MINCTVSFITSTGLLELWVPSNYFKILVPLNFSIKIFGCFSIIKISYLADKNAIATSAGSAFIYLNITLYYLNYI